MYTFLKHSHWGQGLALVSRLLGEKSWSCSRPECQSLGLARDQNAKVLVLSRDRGGKSLGLARDLDAKVLVLSRDLEKSLVNKSEDS